MTFDDGILNIYGIQNLAQPGDKPRVGLVLKSSHLFGFDTVGYNRYYAALKANEQIDDVVRIWRDRTITNHDICILEDNLQYKISLIQHIKDDDGLDITKLTLTRIDEKYEIIDKENSKDS